MYGRAHANFSKNCSGPMKNKSKIKIKNSCGEKKKSWSISSYGGPAWHLADGDIPSVELPCDCSKPVGRRAERVRGRLAPVWATARAAGVALLGREGTGQRRLPAGPLFQIRTLGDSNTGHRTQHTTCTYVCAVTADQRGLRTPQPPPQTLLR